MNFFSPNASAHSCFVFSSHVFVFYAGARAVDAVGEHENGGESTSAIGNNPSAPGGALLSFAYHFCSMEGSIFHPFSLCVCFQGFFKQCEEGAYFFVIHIVHPFCLVSHAFVSYAGTRMVDAVGEHENGRESTSAVGSSPSVPGGASLSFAYHSCSMEGFVFPSVSLCVCFQGFKQCEEGAYFFIHNVHPFCLVSHAFVSFAGTRMVDEATGDLGSLEQMDGGVVAGVRSLKVTRSCVLLAFAGDGSTGSEAHRVRGQEEVAGAIFFMPVRLSI